MSEWVCVCVCVCVRVYLCTPPTTNIFIVSLYIYIYIHMRIYVRFSFSLKLISFFKYVSILFVFSFFLFLLIIYLMKNFEAKKNDNWKQKNTHEIKISAHKFPGWLRTLTAWRRRCTTDRSDEQFNFYLFFFVFSFKFHYGEWRTDEGRHFRFCCYKKWLKSDSSWMTDNGRRAITLRGA